MRLSGLKKLSKDYKDTSGGYPNMLLDGLLKIIKTEERVITFLHNTKTEETAQHILKEGFEFQSHLDYTTDVVTPKDPVTVKYFTIVRQAYGSFTIVIQISKPLVEEYSEMLDNKSHHFSEILSVKPPIIGPEDDLIYCLAPHFIKGYVNANTGEIHMNPSFNASLKIPIFEENLNKIK